MAEGQLGTGNFRGESWEGNGNVHFKDVAQIVITAEFTARSQKRRAPKQKPTVRSLYHTAHVLIERTTVKRKGIFKTLNMPIP